MPIEQQLLLRYLRQDRDTRRAKIERDVQICETIDNLIRLLEAGEMPATEVQGRLEGLKGAVAVDETFIGGRKFERRPEYASLSTVKAVRKILAEKGKAHADEIAGTIFAVPEIQRQKVKSVVVSEIVKGIKRGEFRRVGENIFALNNEERSNVA